MMGREIHEITPRAPQLPSVVSNESTPEGRVQALSQRKKQIEAEIGQHFEVLSANSIDLTTPLIDRDGFPRDDILDLASVRVSRTRIRELKNDLRVVVDQLAEALPLVLPKNGESSGQPANNSTSSNSLMKPFARVDMVLPDSPAEMTGLKVDDQIVCFGHLNSQNHDNLRAIGKLVSESEGKDLTVVWFRVEEKKKRMISKQLTPSSGWGGRGLLGLSRFIHSFREPLNIFPGMDADPTPRSLILLDLVATSYQYNIQTSNLLEWSGTRVAI